MPGSRTALNRIELIRRRLDILPPAPISPTNAGINDEGTSMSNSSVAMVPTSSGSRYLQQLCKHWSHNLAVEFTPEQGTVTFPRNGRAGDFPDDALTTMTAHETVLEVRIDASDPAQLATLKTVVANHLDRFAFREAPLSFDWQDAA